MASIVFSTDFSEEDLRKINAQLQSQALLRPFEIYFDEPYDTIAFYLEHGTGPAQKREGPRSDGKRAYDRIGDWVHVKYGYKSFHDQKYQTNRLYKQIMAVGTPPHPFIKPAVDDVMNLEALQNIFRNGGGMKDVAELLIDTMGMYLEYNDSIRGVGGDSIVNHIRYRMLENNEAIAAQNENTPDDLMAEWDAMDSKNEAEYYSRLGEYRARLRRRR